MFWDSVVNGLAAGGWVIGITIALGVFILLVLALGALLTYFAKDDDHDE